MRGNQKTYFEEVEAFQERVRERNSQLSEIPEELKGLITLKQLKAIYEHLNNPNNLNNYIEDLKEGKPCRLDKESTHLARTLNLVFDPLNQDLQLILETKSKVDKSNLSAQRKTKDSTIPETEYANIKVFTGTDKSTKAAWRIDTQIPVKMANAVYYSSDEENLSLANEEALRAKKAVMNENGEPIGDAGKVINVISLGKEIRFRGYPAPYCI